MTSSAESHDPSAQLPPPRPKNATGRKLKGILPLYIQKHMENRAALAARFREEKALKAAHPKIYQPSHPATPPLTKNQENPSALPTRRYSPDEIIPASTTSRKPMIKPHVPGRPIKNSIKDDVMIALENFRDIFPEFLRVRFWIVILTIFTVTGLSLFKGIEYWNYRQTPEWAQEQLSKMGIPFLPHNFLRAIERDDRSAVDLFLQGQIDANAVDEDGNSPLMLMTIRGDYSKVRLLVERGVDVNFENVKGQSASSLSLDRRHVELFRYFRQVGATNLVDFFSAVKFADPQSIEELVTERFPYNPASDKIHPYLEVFEGKLRYNINLKDEGGVTPLLWSTLRGDVKTVELLLKNGADVDAMDKNEGQTPLMVAAANGIDVAMVPLIQYRAKLDLRDKKGRTALFLAVAQNRPSAIGILLAAGADPNIGERSQGLSVVSAAAFQNNPAILAALIDAGADVTQPDFRGLSALEHAAASGSTDAVKMLISKSGQVYLGQEHTILTAIKIAERQGHQNVVNLLKPLLK